MIEVLNELVRADLVNPQPEYVINDINRQVLTDILMYLSRLQGNLHLHKGILLQGNVGNGKTRLIECIRAIMQEYWRKELCTFTATYIRDNYYKDAEIDGYSLSYKLHNYRFIAINDIGMERNYSTGGNIIQSILFDRFEKRFITHGTTNLTTSEFYKRYSDNKGRMMDRYESMFNYVNLIGGSFR